MLISDQHRHALQSGVDLSLLSPTCIKFEFRQSFKAMVWTMVQAQGSLYSFERMGVNFFIRTAKKAGFWSSN